MANRRAAAGAVADPCTSLTLGHAFTGATPLSGAGSARGGRTGPGRQDAGRLRVTCCFFGEGAVAEGEFHESMNLAALWQLPVLFVCENNLYAMGTALTLSESVTDLTHKAASYAVAARRWMGWTSWPWRQQPRDAAAAVRAGAGPYFLECRTYRFRAHSMFDAELYRDKAEVEAWKQRCPILTLTQRLAEQGLLNDADLTEIEQHVAAEVEAAVAFAEAGTWEPVEDLTRFVYSERRTA